MDISIGLNMSLDICFDIGLVIVECLGMDFEIIYSIVWDLVLGICMGLVMGFVL